MSICHCFSAKHYLIKLIECCLLLKMKMKDLCFMNLSIRFWLSKKANFLPNLLVVRKE